MARQNCTISLDANVNKIIRSPFIKIKKNLYLTVRPITADEVIDTAKAIIAERFTKKTDFLLNTTVAKDYYISKLATLDYEVFCLTYLDAQNQIIAFEELFRGTLNKASIYNREVVRQALKYNAAAVILTHNHPSGRLDPSDQDIYLTIELQRALALVGIKVNDHIIVAGVLAYSFADNGLL